MIRQRALVAVVVLLSSFAVTAAGQTIPTVFPSTHYSILSLGAMAVDLPTLIQDAQSAGYSIVQYVGNDVTARRGDQVIDLAGALTDPLVLLVDNDRFYLREMHEAYTFAVRPAENGYELVVNPQEDLDVTETLTSILVGLQAVGVLGSEVDLAFASYAKADLKGPAAPAGVPIESTLYGLMVSEDWFAFATANHITQVGLRVEVVAEKLPGAALDGEFSSYVVEESESLVKLLLPIDQLLALARSSSIGYVRTAYQPAAL